MPDKIPHTSPSDLNLFIEEAPAWFIKQFLSYRGEVGPAAHRGTAVEFGLVAHLLGPAAVEDAVTSEEGDPRKRALWRYRQLTGGEITDEIEDEAKNVGLMYDQAVTAFQGRANVLQWQRKISTEIEGVPVIGYLDFTYSDCLVDLKTTKAIPSKPRPGHVRQVALYSFATGLPPKLCYVSAKKSLWHDVDEEMIGSAMRQIRSACRAMRRIRAHKNWRDAAEYYAPRDLNSFYYDQTSRYIAQEIWR